MTGYLRCPVPCCDHTVTHVSKPAAAKAMTKHLVDVHDRAEVSARSQADLLLPVTDLQTHGYAQPEPRDNEAATVVDDEMPEAA